MTKEQVNEVLSSIVNQNALIAEIYFVIKEENCLSLRWADIEGQTQLDLTQQFIERLKNEISENEDLSIMKLSESDERKNVLYEYDYEDFPENITMLLAVSSNEEVPTFNFNSSTLNDVKGFVILISHEGNDIILYKYNHPVSIVRKDSGFLSLVKMGNNERLVKLDSDVLKINSSYDFISINGTLFIKNMKILESNFKFHEVIYKKARESLDTIKSVGLIENPNDLEAMVNNISYARKLVRTAKSSPVLGKVPNRAIITFINTYPTLRDTLEVNETGDKIKLCSKKAKELLIKVLNDDFLQSDLTNHFYSSLAKDQIGEYRNSNTSENNAV